MLDLRAPPLTWRVSTVATKGQIAKCQAACVTTPSTLDMLMFLNQSTLLEPCER